MIIVCYSICLILAIRFLIAAFNFLSRPWLPPGIPGQMPLVSVLVPARNEERNIGLLLKSLQNQTYSTIEIIVYNDASDDLTDKIVLEQAGIDQRIRLVNGTGPEPGWLGKNYACHQLASVAQGEYLLFLDADVKLDRNAIGDAIAYTNSKKLDLLSIFPVQEMRSLGEKLVVPMMNWILLSFLPLWMVRGSRNPAFSAANGQFMLFNASQYQLEGYHKLCKSEPVEDIRIIKMMKANGLSVDTRLSKGQVVCRMYEGYADSVRGFMKNTDAFFGNSRLLMMVFSIQSTFGFIPVFYCSGTTGLILYFVMCLIVRILVSITSFQSVLFNIFLSIPQQFSFFIVSLAVIFRNKLKKNTWKGRRIS